MSEERFRRIEQRLDELRVVMALKKQ